MQKVSTARMYKEFLGKEKIALRNRVLNNKEFESYNEFGTDLIGKIENDIIKLKKMKCEIQRRLRKR